MYLQLISCSQVFNFYIFLFNILNNENNDYYLRCDIQKLIKKRSRNDTSIIDNLTLLGASLIKKNRNQFSKTLHFVWPLAHTTILKLRFSSIIPTFIYERCECHPYLFASQSLGRSYLFLK